MQNYVTYLTIHFVYKNVRSSLLSFVIVNLFVCTTLYKILHKYMRVFNHHKWMEHIQKIDRQNYLGPRYRLKHFPYPTLRYIWYFDIFVDSFYASSLPRTLAFDNTLNNHFCYNNSPPLAFVRLINNSAA